VKKGDIVLIPFPFTDLRGAKNRPAVVLFSTKLDITICFITSEKKWMEEYDILLIPSVINGLKTESVIRIGKIATVDIELVLGKLGELSESQVEHLNENLKKIIGLK
jgi:mRNA interferase MazF